MAWRLARVAAQGPVAGTAAGAGYLVSFALQNGSVSLRAVAEIDNFGREVPHPAADDWELRIVDAAGRPLGNRPFGNPLHVYPHVDDSQLFQFSVTIPRLVGQSAIVIVDERQTERLRVPIDDAFRTRAADSRARFLAADGANRQALAAQAGARPLVSATPEPPSGPPPFDQLPMGLKREVAEQLDQLRLYGADAVARAAADGTDMVRAGDAIARNQLVAGRPAAPSAAASPLLGTYTLTGTVTNAETAAPQANFKLVVFQYTSDYTYVRQTAVTTDGLGQYTCGVDAGFAYVSGSANPGYLSIGRWTAAITGNLSLNFVAYPAVVLTGRVTNSAGVGVSGVFVEYSIVSDSSVGGGTQSNATGAFSLSVPKNRAIRFYIGAPAPYLSPAAQTATYAADAVMNLQLETGYAISGTVLGDAGAAINGASVLLRLMAATGSSPISWNASTNASGAFSMVIPRNLVPSDMILAASITGYAPYATTLRVNADTSRTIQLVRGFTVTGTVRDGAAAPVRSVRVRATSTGGGLFTSALTNASGVYSMTLPAGQYDFEAWPQAYWNGSTYVRPLGPVTQTGVNVSGAGTFNFTVSSSVVSTTVRVLLPNAGTTYSLQGRLEVESAGRLLRTIESYMAETSSFHYDSALNKYVTDYTLTMPAGSYDIVLRFLGYQPIRLNGVSAAVAQTLTVSPTNPLLWTGTLRGANGAALPNSAIVSYGDTMISSAYRTTNASGVFSIPITPDGFVKFYADAATANILYTERLGDISTGRAADITLEAVPSFTDTGATLTQMWGTADRTNRWNIVMLGDGYTAITETYTDSNHNGRWDGVLYYDINGNGVWNSGEPYQVYGSAAYPTEGANPTTQNEPFTDVNGDGAPNLRDQALFDRNTLDTLRALFGEDFWRDHRNAFNIFKIRVVSVQAGHDLKNEAGTTILSRNTALGSYFNSPSRGWIAGIDDALVSQFVNQYVPEANTRIVLLNQPVQMGRVMSYITQYGGDIDLGNNYVIAHELGHNLGYLADEYTEFDQTYSGYEPSSANVTSFPDPNRLPWRGLLTPGKEIPSVPGSAGVGVFEGAQYSTGGMYRPTEYCMMSSSERLCPVCTQAIQVRLGDVGDAIASAVPGSPIGTVRAHVPSFWWTTLAGVTHYQFELERGDGSSQLASFDVYQSSLSLGFSLSGAAYRWRIRPATTTRVGAWSAWTAFTVAPPAFTDDPLVAGTSVVKAQHITELRAAIDDLRLTQGLAAVSWTDPSLAAGVTTVKAVHLTEMRTALNAVYVARLLTPPTYTRSTITAGASLISGIDIAELRTKILAIW